MESGNFALDAMVIGPEWSDWKHQFIENGVPCCDIKNKIIYSPAFKLDLTKKEEELIRGKNLHEAAHAHYTPVFETEDQQLYSIVNALEDLRIECLLAEENSLFGSDIRKMNEYILEDIKELLETGKTFPLMEEALSWLMFESADYAAFELSESARPLVERVYDEFQKWKNAETFEDIVEIAKTIQAHWATLSESKSSSSPDSGNSEQEQISSDFDFPKTSISTECAKPLSLKDTVLRKEFDRICEIPKGEYIRFSGYDKFTIPTEDYKSYNSARRRISNNIMKISQYTRAALLALSRCKKSSGQESGILDKRRLADIATGTKKNIFYHTTKGLNLDTAITILLDASGSMFNNTGDVKCLCIALAEAFENLKIKFEILGFTTDYSEYCYKTWKGVRTSPLLTLLFKQFNERYTSSKYRIGSYKALNDNVDGESLMIAWNRNKVQRTHRHIVFVISDGIPCCSGLYPSTLENDLKRTVSLIRKQGGEVYAFGLYTKEPARFYGADNFVYIEDISNLSISFFKTLQEVITK